MTKRAPHPKNNESDFDLLSRVLDHQSDAWSELLRRYRALMFRCITKATSRVGAYLCQDDQDEIFCELCMNLLRDDMRKLRAYDPTRGVKLSTWLGLLAINTAYDHLRRRSRFPVLAPGEDPAPERPSDLPGPLDLLLSKERQSFLGDLVGHLSARDRDFVRLYFEKGLDAERVALTMNISVKTVYTKKHKISARLVRMAELQLAAAA
ncbi:MAG: sigma-70 family RNA polymerase sigma factor [bacterium]